MPQDAFSPHTPGVATKLTVCLLTFNSDRLLEACLKPLLALADEFVVVDSGSTDRTLAILSAHGITPVSRKYLAHSEQMNHAISLSANDWVLCIDSDEILDNETTNNIQLLKRELANEGVAYRLSRHWRVLNRDVRAIYPVSSPDYPTRLFNRRRVKFNDVPVDDKALGFDSTQIIAGRVVHDTFYTLHEVFQKLNGYTTRLCQLRNVQPSLTRALFNPFFAFIKWYGVKGGWRDGRVGLVTGVYAFLYTFLKYFKAWFQAREGRLS